MKTYIVSLVLGKKLPGQHFVNDQGRPVQGEQQVHIENMVGIVRGKSDPKEAFEEMIVRGRKEYPGWGLICHVIIEANPEDLADNE